MNQTSDLLTDLRNFIEAQKNTPVLTFEAAYNPEYYKKIVESSENFIKTLQKQKDGKNAAELTRKVLDIFIESKNHKEVIYYIVFLTLLQNLLIGTITGYTDMCRSYTQSVLQVWSQIEQEEGKKIITMN